MEQTMVNFRMDAELKREMERTCKSMGISMTAAFTMFAVKVTREQRIPFEITGDPFYSEENIGRLRRSIRDVASGKATLKEHELIGEEE